MALSTSCLSLALLALAGGTAAAQPAPAPAAATTLPTPSPQPPAQPAPQPPNGDEANTPPLIEPAPDSKPDAASDKWDVSTLRGTTSSVDITVSEGTWLSLDVSPDGRTIVFDLLGDLYTIPIEGGDAAPLTSGPAWDMHPRFSPCGQWVAFTSDRTGDNNKGGDNIWITRLDGTESRQITRESFRLLTQPTWSPDGQYIVARKHFTGRRSLGAGEMWMYHVNGRTDGLQLTTRQSDQKDAGEPVFSPDGRYLYYSFDAAPGQNFEYDKDSNAGIYAINRLDLVEGRTERFIAGPGGACRPTPSPDGASIAFVRRVRYQTALFVMDIASGIARQVYGNLERDNQETWAIHGVYPGIAYTPDSKAIVFWAGGKIHHLDLESGRAAPIPFRVNTSRQFTQAHRLPVEVAPETFNVKMLRSVTRSPNGDAVAFQALGHIYTARIEGDAPDWRIVGEPRRLTTAADEFEFFPSWSRDGAHIVYVAWNDERLGAVRIARADGAGQPVTVTENPGHYADPVFSPDGAWIVYGKGSGGYLTHPAWSANPGLYAAPNPAANGGTPGPSRFLTRRGTNPHFGADSARVFLTMREGGADSDRVSLISLDLARAADERTHYRSDWATEMAVSPDGRWLAFAERFNVFVTPFLATGRDINIGPKASAAPVVKVSSEAGMNLHWSGDSASLCWSLGPTLMAQPVSHALIPAPRGSEKTAGESAAQSEVPKPPYALPITFTAKHDLPRRADGGESVIALTNARILTMQTDPAGGPRAGRIIDNGVIIVRANRIAAVGPQATTPIPAGAQRIDLRGATVAPGLVDVHAHGAQASAGVTPQKNWIDFANLAFGVTTIHDPSNNTEAIFSAAELARTGLVLSPRTFSTGTILYGAAGNFKAEVESLDDALFHLGRMKAVGAISVKSYNQPRRDQRQFVMEAARRLGIMVVPEGGALYQHNLTMVIDGHTSVEHTLPVENIYSDVAALWGATQVGYTPTLGVAYGGMGGENYWYARTNVWENQRLMNFVPRYVVDPRSRRRTDAPDEEWNHIKAAGIAKRLLDAGVRPTIGAHGQLAGLAAHWEMWMFVQGGMTPFEALRAATIDGAWYVGLDGDIGSIEPGKLADLVVFEQDPTEDIRRSEHIRFTMLNGRLFDALSMQPLAPVAGERPRFFFEELQSGAFGGIAAANLARFAAGCVGCGRPGAACGPVRDEHDPLSHGPSGYR
ncbi:MAG: PD40 domain-containing protein [Phycisphaeraceae bacterium]|nr:PD40 domain-containing protein [Phycisphaeraceae bacterium]